MIRTARLTLSRHGLSDLADSLDLWSDPHVTRFIGGRPGTPEEIWARFQRYAGHWALLGFGYWVVRETATGRFVGEVGIADFHRDIDPPFGDAPELGWAFAPAAWGQGYATEAVTAALDWARGHFGPVRTVCLIDPDNSASLRVAARCGFSEYARTHYKEMPTILFEHVPEGLLQ